MEFTPADYIFGSEQSVLATDLEDHPKLPDGTYKFAELYCTDPSCDCRKTILHVFHNGQSVAQIDFGWESPKFYTKWARGNKEIGRGMSGWASNPLYDYKVNPHDLIDLLKELMDEQWLASIKATYQKIRKEIKPRHHQSHPLSTPKEPSRNSPCPCGSGKKYKRCCLD